MGSPQVFQSLPREGTITVVLYRIGIALSAIIVSGLACLLAAASPQSNSARADFLGFCFKLFEGYLLAMIMPFYLLLASTGSLSGRGVFPGLALIAVILVVFTLRKETMPLAYDIGDQSAYQQDHFKRTAYGRQ